MKILVLFASKSDEEVYRTITNELSTLQIEFDLRIASAHKTPDKVDEIIQQEYDLILTGAGLAAHLSGVVAAHKIVPVLGVWCQGAYDGLDAFLSIVQMPPGIPVLAVSSTSAAREIKKIMAKKDKVAIIGGGNVADKAINTLEELGIPFEMGNTASDAVNIEVVTLGSKIMPNDDLIIYCPAGESKAEDAVRAMNAAEHGLWVGVNRGENAALAAAEILGKHEAVLSHRKKSAEKVMNADEEVRYDK